MQKIVVGIIAVFFVQIGFQVYSAIGSTNYAYNSLSKEPPAEVSPQSVTDAPAIDDLYLASYREQPAAELSEPKVLRQHEPDLPKSSPRMIQAVERAPRRAPAYTTAAIGKDVIITIPPPSVPSYRSVDMVASASPRQEKKRGFFSKSLRVLKKPYDWMKTVAMKLD
jgi:hypothetical protein